MKKVFFAFLLLATITLTTGFSQTTEIRDLSPFYSLKSAGSLDVVLIRGDRESVRLEVKNIDPDKIITEVKNGELFIGTRKGSYWNMQATAFVTYRELEAIYLSGSGNISSEARLSANTFTLKLSGSGNITLQEINAGSVEVSVSGSGDIRLGGRSDHLTLQVTGSGDIHASDLVAQEVIARISGSGDLKVYATESLDAKISGSGDIRYRGTPSSRQIHVTGSGDVIQVE